MISKKLNFEDKPANVHILVQFTLDLYCEDEFKAEDYFLDDKYLQGKIDTESKIDFCPKCRSKYNGYNE